MPSIDYYATDRVESVTANVNFQNDLGWLVFTIFNRGRWDRVTISGTEEEIKEYSKSILSSLASSLDNAELKSLEEEGKKDEA